MKKACVCILSLFLVFLQIFTIVSAISIYFLDLSVEFRKDFIGTLIYEHTILDFYSKSRSNQYYSELSESGYYQSDLILENALESKLYVVEFAYKYTDITNRSRRTQYIFNDLITHSKICISSSSQTGIFQSDSECWFKLYDKGFKHGEKYLLFIDENSGDRFSLQGFAVGYLETDYPYIEIYPGITRYDATYFGAETKYVTANEFVRLFIDAVVDYGGDPPPKE